jgi:hypothetical protein
MRLVGTMPDYRCNRVPGGTYFFTVNLLERNSTLLVAHIDALRDAVRTRRPFHIMPGWYYRTTCTRFGRCQQVIGSS